MAVNELFFERFPDSILEFQIQVRPYNALKTRNMRSLNPEGVCVCVFIDQHVMKAKSHLLGGPIFSVGFCECCSSLKCEASARGLSLCVFPSVFPPQISIS